MNFLQDPIIIVLLSLIFLFGFVALRPRRRPEIWLLILTIFLFALPRAGIILRNINLPLPVAHVLVAVCVVEWLLLGQSRHRDRSRITKFFMIYTAIVGFGLALGLSTGGRYLTAFLELCFYLFSIGLFFYASETFTERRHFMFFAKLILLISVLVSGYGIAQRYVNADILVEHVTYNSSDTSPSDLARSYVAIEKENRRRVLSSYGDPNVLSTQLVVFIGIALAMVIGRKIPEQVRLICLVVLIINIACIMFTGSRTAKVALAVVTLIVLCWRWRWALLLIPVLVITALFFAPAIMNQIIASRIPNADLIDSADIRMRFPAMAWQLLQIAPFGCGFGNTIILKIQGMNWSFDIRPASVIWQGFNSFWLNLFSRLGAAGLIAFAALLAALFRYIYRQVKLIEDAQIKAFIIGALAGCASESVFWLTNNTYMLPGGGLNFWFIMGMLVAGCRAFAQQPYPSMLPANGAWIPRQVAPA